MLNSDWGVKQSVVKPQFLQYRDMNGMDRIANTADDAPRFSFPYLDAANAVPLTNTYKNNTDLISC